MMCCNICACEEQVQEVEVRTYRSRSSFAETAHALFVDATAATTRSPNGNRQQIF